MRKKRLVGFKYYIRKALSVMPDGWWVAFGKTMVNDLTKAAEADGCDSCFCIVDVKEKWGALRVYVVGGGDNIDRVLDDYEERSKRVCVRCGKPAAWLSGGWICPYCDDCAETLHKKDYPIDRQED